MWKLFLKPAVIFIPLCIGAFFPRAHCYCSAIMPYLMFVMFYFVCLKLHRHDLKPAWWHLWLVVVNILIGMTAYFTVKIISGNHNLALVAFFVGITPTASAAPVMADFLHERTGFVMTSFIVTNLVISVFMMLFLPLMLNSGKETHFAGRLILNIFLVIGLPLATAALTKTIYPKAHDWPKKCGKLNFFLWSVMIFVVASKSRHFIDAHPDFKLWQLGLIALVALVLCIINFMVGAAIAPKHFKREMSQSLGQKNTVFTIFISMSFANPLVALGPTCYVLWHNLWNTYLLFSYNRHLAGHAAISVSRRHA